MFVVVVVVAAVVWRIATDEAKLDRYFCYQAADSLCTDPHPGRKETNQTNEKLPMGIRCTHS